MKLKHNSMTRLTLNVKIKKMLIHLARIFCFQRTVNQRISGEKMLDKGACVGTRYIRWI